MPVIGPDAFHVLVVGMVFTIIILLVWIGRR